MLESNGFYNILIGVTGSVATVKLTELIEEITNVYRKLKDSEESIVTPRFRVVRTDNSKRFVSKENLLLHFRHLGPEDLEVFDDEDEWGSWRGMSDPVLHIELRRWADVFVIAPLDANTMAKIANGICDNLLTCTVRAWDMSKPLIYCPAMNTLMYEHPITSEHLSKLDALGYLRVDSIEKKLACGDTGIGAMATVDTIARKVVDCCPNS